MMPLFSTVIATALLLASQVLWSQPKDFSYYGPRIDVNYHFDLTHFLAEDRLTLKELREWMQVEHSYEEFLDFLAARRPELYENQHRSVYK